MGRVPLQVVKQFGHQARQNLYTLNFSAVFTKTASECNTTMEKCQDSINSKASPEKAARHCYEKTCDYLDILNNKIFIQQRALACQSKTL